MAQVLRIFSLMPLALGLYAADGGTVEVTVVNSITGDVYKRQDSSFPSHTAFYRFGGKQKLVVALAAYCRKSPGFEDVLGLCVEQRCV